jgi:hypothetical protein
MTRLATFIFIVATIIWIFVFLRQQGDIPSPPNFSEAPTISQALNLLHIVRYWGINEANASVMVPPGVPFKPVDFVEKNNIKNDDDVTAFDRKAQRTLVYCISDTFNTRDPNHISNLQHIASCLYTNGYDSNDSAYIEGKFYRI